MDIVPSGDGIPPPVALAVQPQLDECLGDDAQTEHGQGRSLARSRFFSGNPEDSPSPNLNERLALTSAIEA
jgi:hypothetical protein